MEAVSSRLNAASPANGEAAVCEHCGAPLHGRYCARCGQDAVEAVAPVREAMARVLSDLFALDLRYPRTLRALFVPGQLPARFLSGHRVPFVPPFRFALSASLLLLLVVAFRLPESASVTFEDSAVSRLAFVASEHPVALTVAWLLTLPAFAAVLWLVFRRSAPLYLSHLTFALYFHGAFALALGALFGLSFAVGLAAVELAGLAVIGVLLGPYLALALRRVYGAPWWRVGVGWAFGAAAYFVLFAVAGAVVIAVATLIEVIGPA